MSKRFQLLALIVIATICAVAYLVPRQTSDDEAHNGDSAALSAQDTAANVTGTDDEPADTNAVANSTRPAQIDALFGRDPGLPPGATSSWGERVQFVTYTTCTDRFLQTTSGETVEVQDCENEIVIDHPYGSYTIEQLEFAANEMKDADAAYILGQRLWREPEHDRRSEANKYLTKAFLISNDAEFYAGLLQQMGVSGRQSSSDPERDAQMVSNAYTMLRVGEKFGVVDAKEVAHVTARAKAIANIDMAMLDEQADEIYTSLSQAREERFR